MQSIHAPQRLIPDPLPWRCGELYPGMLTAREHAAIIRVLRAVEPRPCASITLTWCDDDLVAHIALARQGYVRTVEARTPSASAPSTAPMRWDRIELTPTGALYLSQSSQPLTRS